MNIASIVSEASCTITNPLHPGAASHYFIDFPSVDMV
jgi:hypothetical protein